MKVIAMLIVGLALVAINLRAEDAPEAKEPKELTQARIAYQNSVKALLDPVKKKYIASLEDMKKRLGGKGDVDGAVAVDKEIKSLASSGNNPDDANADIQEPAVPKNYKIIRIEDIKDKATCAVIGGQWPNLLWSNGQGAYYSFSASVTGGKCYVYALYTSGEARPCKVTVNGKDSKQAFEKLTGGFSADTVVSEMIGPFTITGNKATVKIQPVGTSPHFYGFAVSTTPIKDLTKEDFKK